MTQKWTQGVIEMLALHETFRSLGFPADELFVVSFGTGHVQFWLKHRGEQFTIDVPEDRPVPVFTAEWHKALTWWNDKDEPREGRDAVMAASKFMDNRVGLIASLVVRGFYPLKNQVQA